MPSAIVTGATGITGSAIVHHLCKDLEHEKSSADDMAKDFQNIQADHVFFCAYLARDDPVESTRANTTMLSNFIRALELTGAIEHLKRFILTCGFKHYGVHLGNCKQPNLWPRLAERFGCKVPNPLFPHGGVTDSAGFGNYEATTVRMENAHPLKEHEHVIGVKAESSPSLFCQVDPEKWAKRQDVNEAWGKLRDKYNLDQKAWEKATWDFLTFALGRDWSCVGTMSKARKLGWTGYADTWEELEETFEMLEKKGVLPPVDRLKKDF
ncbi:NAD dependent epimerase/dehydratase family protein [Cryptococcus neoformans C23]|uniref:NAD dependent epimerase/dehydratase family protein n=2 Tax=Cryptococcus neoformans TaxID=5207 RepID=A0A854Q7Y0_CRYNE|nr:NAD dependent epimerase/dehydratase [Cryptococcus neoformans var. grubii H99]AUB27577.1 NAD dependent epimerase/dehydratase family protein [Cryptococcus neoformans var. grubii]OWZ28150.1 NAD dependent epimerase/dehydratase family protein [Cryptococcus neoformans var. grubii AD2-60a]OWZ40465.1 NAD dependent epimerase/dehydratase family protein [Cryptococcus neoformans var. grubii C23]OWZ51366.1 NAD dependent epimerase/dehydratase family protein [Cryptococcus neoformans var. grubii 125.91]OXC|eukprot:XP_012052133.1 NAD dependent epimerase/dehydratase [Cryptococcus neoformans var. grubii H99]